MWLRGDICLVIFLRDNHSASYLFSYKHNTAVINGHLMIIEMQIESSQSLTFWKDSCHHKAHGSALCQVPLPPFWVNSFLDSIHPFLCPSIHGRSHLHTAGFPGATTLSIKQHGRSEKFPCSGHMVQSNHSIFHMHMRLISIHTYAVVSSRMPIIGAPINKERSDAWISADLFRTGSMCE